MTGLTAESWKATKTVGVVEGDKNGWGSFGKLFSFFDHCFVLPCSTFNFQLGPGHARGARPSISSPMQSLLHQNFFSDIFTFQVSCFYFVCGDVARLTGAFLVIKVQWCLVGVYEGNFFGAVEMCKL